MYRRRKLWYKLSYVRVGGKRMLLNVTRVLMVASLSVVLIVGSIIPNNYGLSQTFISLSPIGASAGSEPSAVPSSYLGLFSRPTARQGTPVMRGVQLSPEFTFIVVAFFALAHPHFLPLGRDYAVSQGVGEDNLLGPWVTHPNKYRHKQTGPPVRKKHNGYYKRNARPMQG